MAPAYIGNLLSLAKKRLLAGSVNGFGSIGVLRNIMLLYILCRLFKLHRFAHRIIYRKQIAEKLLMNMD